MTDPVPPVTCPLCTILRKQYELVESFNRVADNTGNFVHFFNQRENKFRAQIARLKKSLNKVRRQRRK